MEKVTYKLRDDCDSDNHYYAKSESGMKYSVVDIRSVMESAPLSPPMMEMFDYWEAIPVVDGDLNTDVILRAKDRDGLTEEILDYETELKEN